MTWKCGGDAMSRHYNLWDILVESFHRAHLSVNRVEVGSWVSADISLSCPGDILVQDWDRGKPAASDVSHS